MAYGFNDDKSKAEIYTKEEIGDIIDEKITPSEWTDLSSYVSSHVEVPTSKSLEGRRIGNKVQIRGRLKIIQDATADRYVALNHLPNSFAPAVSWWISPVYFVNVTQTGTGDPYVVQSNSTGGLNINFSTSVNRNNTEINVNWEYYID